MRRFDAYIKNSTTVRKESLINQKALDSDITAKQKYQTFEKIVQAKSQVQFLECEMQHVCGECWDIRRDISVLHCMIINKYPLPISTASCVEQAISKLVNKTVLNINGFKLILRNKEGKTMYGENRRDEPLGLQLTLILHDEHFYVARGSASKTEEIKLPCFLYEGLCEISALFGLIFHSADEFVSELVDSFL